MPYVEILHLLTNRTNQVESECDRRWSRVGIADKQGKRFNINQSNAHLALKMRSPLL
ncbi:MAG: hypothetical protein AB4426_02565 [Xenococcaceae cyanobacterium]